jgi:hypothetical protein
MVTGNNKPQFAITTKVCRITERDEKGRIVKREFVPGRYADDVYCKHVRSARQQQPGTRCGKPRDRGCNGYCKFHFKWHTAQTNNNAPRSRRHAEGNDMARFYRNHLTKSLGALVDDALSINPNEQLQLYEELALMRDVAGQAVALYGISKDLADKEPNEKNRSRVFEAGQLMQSQLSEVVRICESASRIANARNNISPDQLGHLVAQLKRCAQDAFGDDPRVLTFDKLINEQVRVPMEGSTNGTMLTPDLDAKDMDGSVPEYVPVQIVDAESNAA